MSEPFPIWITKWCLSQGIQEATAVLYPANKFWCVVMSGNLRGQVMQAGQWYRTREAAVKEANKVLARALQSQRERLEELESVVFTDGGEGEGTGDSNG
jgi:galactokinase